MEYRALSQDEGALVEAAGSAGVRLVSKEGSILGEFLSVPIACDSSVRPH